MAIRFRFAVACKLLMAVIVAAIIVSSHTTINNNNVNNKSMNEQESYTTTNNKNKKKSMKLLYREDIFVRGWDWDASPIVVASHKLVFFTLPKVGCTVFKQLFRRMMGRDDWKRYQRGSKVHNPLKNGLVYLFDYSIENASSMLASKEWTKAIFVREPKERLLSAYLDKVARNNGSYVVHHCCRKKKSCAPQTMLDFIELSQNCYDPHWAPQPDRVKHWGIIDFVGSFGNIHNDTKRLLQRIGAWDEFGSYGWGESGTEEIFGSSRTRHATGSESLFYEYYTESLERKVEERYAQDYANEAISEKFS